MVVDDSILSLRQVAAQLSGSYEFSLVKSGREAVAFQKRESADLVLLDVEMPEMDGFQTIAALKALRESADVPVIFLTGNIDDETQVRALEAGAVDFITKPVDKSILLHRIALHLRLYEYRTNLSNAKQDLENGIVESFADLVECKDRNTGDHVMRTGKYLRKLGRELIARGLFPDELSEETLDMMVQAAPFHDIGKIGISDIILLKPSPLTAAEYEEVKHHTSIGGRLLERLYQHLPSQRFLEYAMIMAEGHHERFDGKGYPWGRKGTDIPLCCRLLSVVNVFDACRTNRCYRPGMSVEKACSVVEQEAGKYFDPTVVDAFRAIMDSIDEFPEEKSVLRRRSPEGTPDVQSIQTDRMKEILVVDDNLASLKQIGVILADDYAYSLAVSGEQAWASCARSTPDLILLDVEMPGTNGFDVIARIRENPVLSHIPVIFLTGNRDVTTEVRGLQSGAVDFIKKPVSKNILLHRIKLHLNIAAWEAYLTGAVREMSDHLAISIAELIECRDENTGGHVARTADYMRLIGKELQARGRFPGELSDAALEMMVRGAPLHDIGKVFISDRILLKPDRLDEAEFEKMKTHATVGATILENMFKRTPTQTYLRYAVMIAASHHERYDGRGYPRGLVGKDIPFCGRLMAVADVYDALVDDRVYRKGLSHAEAFHIIMEGRGTQFDPEIVDAFEACEQTFAEMVSLRRNAME